jgi:hypothetical protein
LARAASIPLSSIALRSPRTPFSRDHWKLNTAATGSMVGMCSDVRQTGIPRATSQSMNFFRIRAQIIIVAPLFENPVDEIEHPDTFRTIHENCTFK